MKTALFNYHLPHERIAQSPASPRDSSRLLVFDRKTKQAVHDHFIHLSKYLKPGDVLVFNDTKVFPARLLGQKISGGKMEVFLLRPVDDTTWEVLIGGKVRRTGLVIAFKLGLRCEVKKQMANGIWHVVFNKSAKKVLSLADKIGSTPTPPYIKKPASLSEYQTVYAKKVGSVAAPTAGFHFTKHLLKALKRKGVQFEYVTLHVGFGTFQPVKVDDIKKHHMHAEYAEISKKTLGCLHKAKKEGRRIIAVGTTSVRVLETVMGGRHALAWRRDVGARAFAYPTGGFRGWINTFIYPGYHFNIIDAMITNFHLPKSTLLMLVSAFAGRQDILKLYKMAIRKKYRFYSFGDGMMIV